MMTGWGKWISLGTAMKINAEREGDMPKRKYGEVASS